MVPSSPLVRERAGSSSSAFVRARPPQCGHETQQPDGALQHPGQVRRGRAADQGGRRKPWLLVNSLAIVAPGRSLLQYYPPSDSPYGTEFHGFSPITLISQASRK